jgi:hypothetical protein
MQFLSIKRTMVTLGIVAALLIGTAIVSSMAGQTATAQAAELAQHCGGYGDGSGHHSGGRRGLRHCGSPSGHASFSGHIFHTVEGFSHRYWGWGFHRTHPQYYVAYYYEPVSVCENYYFDDDGAWYCFVTNVFPTSP